MGAVELRVRVRIAAGLAAFILTFGLVRGDGLGLPDATDPVAGMGVNIHFTDPKPGELEMLAQAGFRWVRMDFPWTQTEKQPGVYDFSAFDRLFASLDKFHLRAVMIFDYTNPLYDQGKPSCTDAGRQAFAKWAVAAVTHFKGRGVLWEIWNEPNGDWFWKPKPNPEDYAKLAMTVTMAIHDAAPEEMVTGPALSCGLPWPDPVKTTFLDVVAGSGVLKYWPAITVHPYLRTSPETYKGIYDDSRQVIDKHAGPGQKVAIICGESGHNTSTNSGDVDEVTQGEYVARTYLVDVLEGVPLTIWYDWHDDGPNPKDGEQRFGTVRYPYHAGADPVYEPKPAYLAAKTYASQLANTHFVERLKTDSPDDYLLSFTSPAGPCVVAWTTAKNPHEVKIPLADGDYNVTSFDGAMHSQAQAAGGLALTLDGGPQYITKYIKK
jgi:hypothetical protein